MTFLATIGALIGVALIVAGHVLIVLRVDQLTHHINRLIEAEDRRNKRQVKGGRA